MYKLEFLQMTQALTKAFSAMLQPLREASGLPRVAFTALMFLGDHPEKNTGKDISEFCGIRPSLVSMYIEQLVTLGYLVRIPDAEDRRKVLLAYTDKAQAVFAQRNECMEKFCLKMLEGVSEEEIAVWHHFAQTVTENACKMIVRLQKGED